MKDSVMQYARAVVCVTLLVMSGSAEGASLVPLNPAITTPLLTYDITFEITNRFYNNSLLNPESSDYKMMYEEVSSALNSVYGCPTCPTSSFYQGVRAMTFRSGSVVVQATVVFHTDQINAVLIRSLFLQAIKGKNEISGLQINPDFTHVLPGSGPAPASCTGVSRIPTTTPTATPTTNPLVSCLTNMSCSTTTPTTPTTTSTTTEVITTTSTTGPTTTPTTPTTTPTSTPDTPSTTPTTTLTPPTTTSTTTLVNTTTNPTTTPTTTPTTPITSVTFPCEFLNSAPSSGNIDSSCVPTTTILTTTSTTIPTTTPTTSPATTLTTTPTTPTTISTTT